MALVPPEQGIVDIFNISCKVGVEFVDSKGNFWHIYDAQVEAKMQPSGVV